jgi:hypothetical protein
MALAAILSILSMAKRRFGKYHSAPVSLPFLLSNRPDFVAMESAGFRRP